MKSKGFTLIELLAVIVILAIIALIATPVVLNIIKDSKSSSIERSAELYLDQVKTEIARYNMANPEANFNPSVCEVQSGGLKCDGVNDIIPVDIEGNKPKNGSKILLSNGKIESLVDFVIDGNNIILVNGKCKIVDENNKIICTGVESASSSVIGTEMDIDISTKVPLGNYLPGDEYVCQVNSSQTQHFVVLGTNGDKVNLLMTSNIDSTGTAVTATTGTDERVRWNSTWDRTLGPVGAMELLNKATSSWTNIPNLNETYDDEGGNFTNYKISGKARLPKVSEVEALGNVAFINLAASAGGSYCDYECYSTISIGYWTLSSSKKFEYAAMVVDSRASGIISGNDSITYHNEGVEYGVRPVITLNKSNLHS